MDVEPVDCVRDLSVLLDCSLSMHQHIARVTSTCFSQAQPHTWYRRPKATCLRCNTDPCRLLQLCACWSVQLRSSTTGASTSRGRAVCLGLAAAGPHHSCTADTTLASGASTYYLQVVHTDAWCCLRIRAFLSTICCVTTHDATRKSASAVSGQWTVRRIPRVSSSVGTRAFSIASPQAWHQRISCSLSNALCLDIQAPFKS